MIIALPVWEDRISPVFDVAAMILLAEIENGDVLNRRFVPFNPDVANCAADPKIDNITRNGKTNSCLHRFYRFFDLFFQRRIKI